MLSHVLSLDATLITIVLLINFYIITYVPETMFSILFLLKFRIIYVKVFGMRYIKDFTFMSYE